MECTRIGEDYVNTARETGEYKDRTKNLRNANSYEVYKNGASIFSNTGRPQTAKLFEKEKTGAGIELLEGNGMEYASYVEGKGYNVCTEAFMKSERDLRNKFG
jgi:hypothetical protein